MMRNVVIVLEADAYDNEFIPDLNLDPEDEIFLLMHYQDEEWTLQKFIGTAANFAYQEKFEDFMAYCRDCELDALKRLRGTINQLLFYCFSKKPIEEIYTNFLNQCVNLSYKDVEETTAYNRIRNSLLADSTISFAVLGSKGKMNKIRYATSKGIPITKNAKGVMASTKEVAAEPIEKTPGPSDEDKKPAAVDTKRKSDSDETSEAKKPKTQDEPTPEVPAPTLKPPPFAAAAAAPSKSDDTSLVEKIEKVLGRGISESKGKLSEIK